MCMCDSTGTCRDQRRVLDPLEMELQEVENRLWWVLGTEFRSWEEQEALCRPPSSALLSFPCLP